MMVLPKLCLSEESELLLWCINQEKKAEEKEFKVAQAIVNRRTVESDGN